MVKMYALLGDGEHGLSVGSEAIRSLVLTGSFSASNNGREGM